MISRNDPRTPKRRSSRIRSKITIVSLMLNPMMVNAAATIGALNSLPGQKEPTHGHQQIMHDRHHRRDRKGKFVPHRHIGQYAQHRQQRRDNRRLLNLPPHRRPHLVQLHALEFASGNCSFSACSTRSPALNGVTNCSDFVPVLKSVWY
jgi:hypothetical protein